MESSAECDRLVAVQHGVISRTQALGAGLSERAIGRRVASGRWNVVYAGVYAVRAIPRTWHQRLMAAVLCGGPSALASHRSAAALWALDGVEERPVEISVKAGRRIKNAIVHRRQPRDDPRVALLECIPATGIDRTLLDVAAVLSPRRAGLALDDALRRKLTTRGKVREMLLGSRGRPGARSLRKLLDVRDDRDGVLESRLEAALLRLLRDHQLPLPVAQHRVMHGDVFVARLDFAYPSHRLGIEADGFRWHASPERWARDLRRENRLKVLGWMVLRFSWQDVHDRPEMVAGQIRAALSSPRSLNNQSFRYVSERPRRPKVSPTARR
jgi:very-short-patch-repair endonuclease